jgi:hypothetical protein
MWNDLWPVKFTHKTWAEIWENWDVKTVPKRKLIIRGEGDEFKKVFKSLRYVNTSKK